MREIKFKVYCKKHNREETYTIGDLITGEAMMENGEGGIFENWREYTGLKDKNEKEIYEGDIIKDSFYERKGKVLFLEGAFWLDYIEDFKEYGTIHKRYQLLSNYDNKEVIEVIGNIYENPELLKED